MNQTKCLPVCITFGYSLALARSWIRGFLPSTLSEVRDDWVVATNAISRQKLQGPGIVRTTYHDHAWYLRTQPILMHSIARSANTILLPQLKSRVGDVALAAIQKRKHECVYWLNLYSAIFSSIGWTTLEVSRCRIVSRLQTKNIFKPKIKAARSHSYFAMSAITFFISSIISIIIIDQLISSGNVHILSVLPWTGMTAFPRSNACFRLRTWAQISVIIHFSSNQWLRNWNVGCCTKTFQWLTGRLWAIWSTKMWSFKLCFPFERHTSMMSKPIFCSVTVGSDVSDTSKMMVATRIRKRKEKLRNWTYHNIAGCTIPFG